MNTKNLSILTALALSCGMATAENIYWAGGQTGYWDDANAWTNESGTVFEPVSGHTAVVQGPIRRS